MRFYSHGWHSPCAERYMEFLHYGHSGAPIVVFPTTSGNHYEFPERGMLEPLSWKIEQGLIQIFCVDTTHWDGWYNEHCPAHRKVELEVMFERYLIHEFLPYLRHETGNGYVTLFGISFGAYHAMNFALKHPDLISRVVAMFGSFDIKGLLHGYYDEQCYFNNPVDYLPNLTDSWFLDRYRSGLEIVLITSDNDITLERNRSLSSLLNSKGIRHTFHQWSGDYPHDWQTWQQMIPHYL